MNKQLNEKYIKEMKECGNGDKHDTESGHRVADGILCELLETLGYTELIEVYQDLDKWYS